MALDDLQRAAVSEARNSFKGMAGELSSLGLNGGDIAENAVNAAAEGVLQKYQRLIAQGRYSELDILCGKHKEPTI